MAGRREAGAGVAQDGAAGGGKVRLFFALWPDSKTRAALAAWQKKLARACGGRVMRPWTLHVTLAFLGATPEDRLDAVKEAAAGTRGGACEMIIDQAAFWPHNRIVWVGTDTPPPALTALESGLRSRLAAAGIAFDAKPFVAHVTLLRNARPPRGELPADSVPWAAQDFVLVESQPSPEGSRYEIIARFPLR